MALNIHERNKVCLLQVVSMTLKVNVVFYILQLKYYLKYLFKIRFSLTPLEERGN